MEDFMTHIERKTVASGVIGQYDHEWEVQRLYDKKNDSECYNLYINKVYICCFSSIVKALSVLVETFDEE
jgi:hypothetical protein